MLPMELLPMAGFCVAQCGDAGGSGAGTIS